MVFKFSPRDYITVSDVLLSFQGLHSLIAKNMFWRICPFVLPSGKDGAHQSASKMGFSVESVYEICDANSWIPMCIRVKSHRSSSPKNPRKKWKLMELTFPTWCCVDPLVAVEHTCALLWPRSQASHQQMLQVCVSVVARVVLGTCVCDSVECDTTNRNRLLKVFFYSFRWTEWLSGKTTIVVETTRGAYHLSSQI